MLIGNYMKLITEPKDVRDFLTGLGAIREEILLAYISMRRDIAESLLADMIAEGLITRHEDTNGVSYRCTSS